MFGDENLCIINSDSHFWLHPKEKTLKVELLGHSTFMHVTLYRHINAPLLSPTTLPLPSLWLWNIQLMKQHYPDAVFTQGTVTPVQGLRRWSYHSGLSKTLQVANKRLLLKHFLSAHITWVRGTPEKQGWVVGWEDKQKLWFRRCLGSHPTWGLPWGWGVT